MGEQKFPSDSGSRIQWFFSFLLLFPFLSFCCSVVFILLQRSVRTLPCRFVPMSSLAGRDGSQQQPETICHWSHQHCLLSCFSLKFLLSLVIRFSSFSFFFFICSLSKVQRCAPGPVFLVPRRRPQEPGSAGPVPSRERVFQGKSIVAKRK